MSLSDTFTNATLSTPALAVTVFSPELDWSLHLRWVQRKCIYLKTKKKELFNDHFLQCTNTSHPPHHFCCRSTGIPCGSLLALSLFPFCASSDTWLLPPPAVRSALSQLPPCPSLIGPDIDGSWMLANDCLWSLFTHPLLTLPVTPYRLDLHAKRSPGMWISPSVLQLAESFNLWFIYIVLFLLIPMSVPNLCQNSPGSLIVSFCLFSSPPVDAFPSRGFMRAHQKVESEHDCVWSLIKDPLSFVFSCANITDTSHVLLRVFLLYLCDTPDGYTFLPLLSLC